MSEEDRDYGPNPSFMTNKHIRAMLRSQACPWCFSCGYCRNTPTCRNGRRLMRERSAGASRVAKLRAELAALHKRHEEAALGWAESRVALNRAEQRIADLEADMWHESRRRDV